MIDVERLLKLILMLSFLLLVCLCYRQMLHYADYYAKQYILTVVDEHQASIALNENAPVPAASPELDGYQLNRQPAP